MTTKTSQKAGNAKSRGNSTSAKDIAEMKDLKLYLNKYSFNLKELIMLRKRYVKMSRHGMLDKKSFREALGLLGLEHAAFLCNRIFEVIDEDGSESCNFDEFLKYMNTLIYGNPKEKARQSFRMLDGGKTGKILYADIEAMIMGVSQLWNSLTGSKIQAGREYITRIFKTFDVDNDGVISFEDFEKAHDLSSDIFGWFEFFNQDSEEIVVSRKSIMAQNQVEALALEQAKSIKVSQAQSENVEMLEGRIKFMESELLNVISFVQQEQEKSRIEMPRNSRAESFFSNISTMTKGSNGHRTNKFLASEPEGQPFFMNISSNSYIANNKGPDSAASSVKSQLRGSNISLSNTSIVHSRRDINMGGPAFIHEPIQCKDADDDDDVVRSPSNESLESPSRVRSISPIHVRDSSISPSPFDYYRDEDGYEASSALPSLEPSQSFLEINSRLSKLQDYFVEFKDQLKNKSTPASAGLPGSNGLPSTKESEQSEYNRSAAMFNQSISVGINDGFGDRKRVKSIYNNVSMSTPGELSNSSELPEMRLKKRALQIQTESKGLERKQTSRGNDAERRKNISVFFGHENWNLVLNMMIGLRTSIKSIEPRNYLEKLNDNEFKLKSRYELIQKRTEGFDIRKACRFYDYFPHVFEDIRRQYGIQNKDFLKSCGPETLLGNLIIGNMSSLTELSSTGKSGSFFYFSEDGRYMLKTIPKREFISLKRIMREYYTHIMEHQQTLISRIFGLYKMKFYRTKTSHISIYFIVMGNLFSSDLAIDVRYDLKGSTHGRTSKKKGQLPDKSIALKDLDFNEEGLFLDLPPEDKEMLKKQIEIDVKFCAAAKVIDYSLLIGIHHVRTDESYTNPMSARRGSISSIQQQMLATPNFNAAGISFPNQLGSQTNLQTPYNSQNSVGTQRVNSLQQLQSSTDQLIRGPRFYEKYYGGMLSSDKKKIYVIGIIDMLTEFTTTKRMENVVKKTFLGKGISCVPPSSYADRFKNYILSKIK